MDSIFAALLENISNYAVDPIAKQLGYVFCFKANIENLKEEAVKLGDMKDRVQNQVIAARRNAENINCDTERWLVDADNNGKEAETIIQDEANFINGCFNQWCLNLKPRYVLSRNAKKKTNDIIKLCQNGNFVRVSHPPHSVPIVVSTSTVSFETHECILKEIIRKLKDENISMVGICGMGGVGKTTMAETVCKRVKEQKLFDDCAMTDISQELDIAKTQKHIAEMLGLQLSEENPIMRRGKLQQRLENSRVLVILDDVWEEFDLKELGITFQGPQKGCKVLFTARAEGLWRVEVKEKIEYPLNILNEEEAWKLFKAKVNDPLEDESEMQSVAKEIVKECGGLPLALVTIGGALKQKNIYSWKDTLRQLKTDYPIKIRGISAKVYQSLELSYNFLDEDDAKLLFLLCSMFKEDYDIHPEDLIRMVHGLRLFKGINGLEQTRDRVFSLLEDLKNRYLLLPGRITDPSTIRVHDVVRDVAKSIAMKEPIFALVVENRDGVTMLQEHNTVKHPLWMSIISKDIKELPTELRFPQVKLLRCSNNVLQTTVSFLEEMKEIRVLDVDGTGLPRFPSSLRLLSSLLTLFFRNCDLNDLSAIGDLPHLECLSFAQSLMKDLPKEIGHLSNLVSLDLTSCSELRTIQPGIISGLCQLQELYMGNTLIDWERGENKQGKNASLGEFESLSNLRTLHIKIKDPIALIGSQPFRNLKKYRIHIGDGYNDDVFGSYDKCCLIHLSMPVPLEGNIKFLTKNSEELRLRGEFTKDLVHGLVQDGSRSLKSLDVRDIDSLEYLANAEASLLLPRVESLHLSSLGNLKQLSRSPLMGGSFENLKDLKVRFCGKLKNLFQLSVATGFVHLNELNIGNCECMEEVIWKEHKEDETNKLAFPKMEFLGIHHLPSLVSFCRGIDEVEFPQLEDMDLYNLPKVECLFSGFSNESFFPFKVSFPSIKSIELSNMENMKEIWCDQLQSGSFCNLTELNVDRCHKLRAVFTPSVARYLLHLQTLSIWNCSLLEVVVVKEEEEDTTLLPELKEVVLRKLPSLECFCHVAHDLEYPMLSDVQVIECQQLKTFSPGCVRTPVLNNVRLTYNWDTSVTLWEENLNTTIALLHKQYQFGSPILQHFEVSDIDTLENLANAEASSLLFTTLETLSLKNLDNLQHLSHSPLVVILGRFKNLTSLCVSECNQLKNLFHLSVVTEFMHLQKLVIKDCKNMEEVIWKEHDEDETNKLTFPKLKSLKIHNLPSLVSFCRGIDNVEFPQLETMSLWDLPEVECLFSGFSNESFFPFKVSFPSIKSIELSNMENMKEIWCDQLQSGSFCNLTELNVDRCHKLRAVFTPSVARYLLHLQTLSIWDCSLLEVVVVKEEEEDTTLLPELKKVVLDELPSLECFCHVAHDLEYPMLSDVKVIECPQLKTFSPGCVRTPVLNNVRLTNNWDTSVTLWEENLNTTIALLHKQYQFGSGSLQCFEVSDIDTLENLANAEASSLLFTTLKTLSLKNLDNLQHLSHSPLVVILGRFKNLTSLCVSECNQLKNLFHLSVVTEFMHLETLAIKDCKNMEEVIWKEHDEDETNKLTFPKLNMLEIKDLPSLVCFCGGIDEVEFCKMYRMSLKKLPKVECLFSALSNQSFFPRKVSFSSLYLYLEDMVNMKEIWSGQLQNESICNLTKLNVCGCHKLRVVFTPSVAKYMVHLRGIDIKDCSMLEVVIAKEEEEDRAKDITLFPELARVYLNELPVLESFCHVTHDLEYPKLSTMHVIKCPELKIFSPGFVRTPELDYVTTDWKCEKGELQLWEGNLNSTITRIHKQNQEERRQCEDGSEQSLHQSEE